MNTMYSVGQGFVGNLGEYSNGIIQTKDRPYLIVETCSNYIKVLTVASTKGVEHKLLYSSNYPLSNHRPPFRYPSYVQLDSLQLLDSGKSKKCIRFLCDNGRALNGDDLSEILKQYRQD